MLPGRQSNEQRSTRIARLDRARTRLKSVRSTAAFIIIAMALLTAAAVVPAVALLRPAYLLIGLSGVLVLVPVLIVRDARAYWLFPAGAFAATGHSQTRNVLVGKAPGSGQGVWLAGDRNNEHRRISHRFGLGADAAVVARPACAPPRQALLPEGRIYFFVVFGCFSNQLVDIGAIFISSGFRTIPRGDLFPSISVYCQ